MKRKILFSLLPILGLALVLGVLFIGLPGAVGAQEPLGTAFTYQGRLNYYGYPARGTYDFDFRLYDALSGGSQVGSTVTKDDVIVTDGIFTATLDFGSNVFTGDARWLEIGVRPGDSTGDYTILSPRQELMPAPYALALPGLRTQPNDTSPNVIGGYSGNSVTDGVVGATISGGGHRRDIQGLGPNTVTDRYGTVGGGKDNQAGNGTGTTTDALYATVGGGDGNIASGLGATVGGGSYNRASGEGATVPGGVDNYAVGDLSFAAGLHAKANHDGSFVWADSTNAVFASTAEDQFLVRANGGAVITGTRGAYGYMLDVTNSASHYGFGIRGTGDVVGVTGYSTVGTGVDGYGPYVGVSGRSTDGIGVKATSFNGVALYARTERGSGNIIEAWSGWDRVFSVNRQGNAEITGNLAVGTLNGGTPWTSANDSSGSGLDADLLDGQDSIAFQKRVTGTCTSGNAIRVIDANGAVTCEPVGGGGGGTTSAAHGFAEMYPCYDASPGDVVVIASDGHCEHSSSDSQKEVLGVYASEAGFIAGAGSGGVPVVIAGITQVNANGYINPGDLLVTSSTPGYVRRADDVPPAGTIVGKALQSLGATSGQILILVTLQ